MFRRSKKTNEYDDDLYLDEFDYSDDDTLSSGASLPGRFMVVLITIVVIVAISALGFLGLRFWQSTTPVYAAEDWFDAMWAMDSETVLDRTCDDEIWVSNAIASGASIGGMVEYLDITQIPDLEKYLIPGVDLESIKNEFEIDRSRIVFEEVISDEQTAVVTAKGQLRIRVFKGWYPYRLDETWQIMQEDGRWKWCGRQP